MEDVRTYCIRIGGQVAEAEIASFCPPGWKLEPAADTEAETVLTVITDQSGLVGFIRRLHGLGFELLAIHCD
jgi:hypothetical protein